MVSATDLSGEQALRDEVKRLEELLRVWGPSDFALNHKCHPIGVFGPHKNEEDGIVRKVWVGRLDETCPGWEAESHCLHIEVGEKRRVIGLNDRRDGDCLVWFAMFMIIYNDPLPDLSETIRLLRKSARDGYKAEEWPT
ncbi:MAG: hypothetical protein ACREJ6_14330 [Candidatus Methylomirabilis sp.]